MARTKRPTRQSRHGISPNKLRIPPRARDLMQSMTYEERQLVGTLTLRCLAFAIKKQDEQLQRHTMRHFPAAMDQLQAFFPDDPIYQALHR